MRISAPVLAFVLSAGMAWAEGKHALVIAAADYDQLRDLANPVPDAASVADLLDGLGFEVTLETDRDLRRTRRALEDFAEDAAGAELVLFYYAGHGTEVGGENRLLPTDTRTESPEALRESSLPLTEVVGALTAIAPATVMILDACRNDPFAGTGLEELARAAVPLEGAQGLALAEGFARVGPAENLIYAFATAPGDTASDGPEGAHSPFAEALMRHLVTPGLEFRTALTLVTQDVYDRTRGAQTPYFESGLPDLVFAAGQLPDLGERDGLLLAMAGIAPDLRAEIETLAADRQMPLAPLYAAVLANGLETQSAPARRAALEEAAESYADFQNRLTLLSTSDPRVEELRRAAAADMALGARQTALDRYDEAAAIDAEAGEAAGEVFVSRKVSQAVTLLQKADAARAGLDRDLALRTLEEVEAILALVEPLGIPREAMEARTNALWDRGNLLMLMGDTAGALAVFRQWQDLATARSAAAPEDMGFLRDLGVSRNNVGDVLVKQGDLTGAAAAYDAALVVAADLATRAPDNMKWQSDVLVVRIKMGDVRLALGDQSGAEQEFRAAIAVADGLLAAEPGTAEWQRMQAVGQERLGDLLMQRGDLAGAGVAIKAALATHQARHDASPEDMDTQRDLALALEKLGTLLSLSGDLAGAEARLRESQALSLDLMQRDPANTLWQRDLSVSHMRMATLQFQIGDLARAETSVRAALALREALVTVDPANLEWRRDLSSALTRLGDMALARKDVAGAEEAYRRALAIAEDMAVLDPGNADWQRDLGISRERLGDALQAKGDMAGAEGAYRAALEVSGALAARDSGNTGWQVDHALGRVKLAFLLADPRPEFEAALATLKALQAEGKLAPAQAELVGMLESLLAMLPAP